LKNKKLKVLQLQKGKNYKKTEKLEFTLETNQVIIKKVFINLYTKAQSIGIKIENDYLLSPNEYKFEEKNLQYLNFDEIFFELLKYKKQKKYTNISIDKNRLNNFVNSQEWYRIEAPKTFFIISNFKDFEKIQSVFISLLKKYLYSFYQYNKNFWEKDFMEYREISEKDANFIDEYNVSIERKEENNDLIERVK